MSDLDVNELAETIISQAHTIRRQANEIERLTRIAQEHVIQAPPATEPASNGSGPACRWCGRHLKDVDTHERTQHTAEYAAAAQAFGSSL